MSRKFDHLISVFLIFVRLILEENLDCSLGQNMDGSLAERSSVRSNALNKYQSLRTIEISLQNGVTIGKEGLSSSIRYKGHPALNSGPASTAALHRPLGFGFPELLSEADQGAHKYVETSPRRKSSVNVIGGLSRVSSGRRAAILANREGRSATLDQKKQARVVNHYENERIAQEFLKRKQEEAQSFLRRLSHGNTSLVTSHH